MPVPPVPISLDEALALALRLARAGEAQATRECLAAIRARHDIATQPRAAVGTMLAEGIMASYADEPVVALDRLRRALALAQAGRDDALLALGHAWLALCHVNACQTELAIDHAAAAVRIGPAASGPASARAGNVLGAVHQLCGADESARAWFEFAREHARRDDDALMVSAALFNMSACRLSDCRFTMICDGAAGDAGRLQLLFLKSSENYDRARGLDQQSHLHERTQGMALALAGEHAAALALLARHVCARTPQEEHADAFVLAERAWCRLQLGDRPGAGRDAAAAAGCLSRLNEDDDIAISHRRLSEVHAALGDGAAAARHRAVSDAAADRFRRRRAAVRDYLARCELKAPVTTEAERPPPLSTGDRST